jgi:hypothetical protein
MERADQAGYFHRRAEEERAAANCAGDERAARSHRELAQRYAEVANGRHGAWDEDEQPCGGTMPSEFRILP